MNITREKYFENYYKNIKDKVKRKFNLKDFYNKMKESNFLPVICFIFLFLSSINFFMIFSFFSILQKI